MPSQEREEPDLLKPAAVTRVTNLLRHGEVEVVGRLPYSSNSTFLVRCCDDDGQVAAVYKPVSGERPLMDFPEGTLYRREVATYIVDQALGWDIVPPTVGRDDAPLGTGSLQLFIDHDPEQHFFTLRTDRADRFRTLAMFDILCNNADRKSGHCLLDASGHVFGVDHGLTFHVAPKLRTVIWDFAGEPMPAAERAEVGRFAERLDDSVDPLRAELGAWLAEDEIEVLALRASVLQQPGDFPEPESSWSFPWPLV